MYDANWAQVGNAQADSDGTWSIEVMPGTYRVNAYSDRSGGNASTNNEPQPFTADTTVACTRPPCRSA